MLRAYGSWIPTANLVLIPNSIKNNLKDVCINKGLKPACPVGRPVAIDNKISRDFSPSTKLWYTRANCRGNSSIVYRI